MVESGDHNNEYIYIFKRHAAKSQCVFLVWFCKEANKREGGIEFLLLLLSS